MKSFLDNLICAPSGGNDKMKPDQERVKTLLTDTVTLLCKNGLQYSKELKVQGLLGITLDNDDVFVVHINEIFNGLLGAKVSSVKADESSTSAIAAADSATSDVVLKSRKGIPHKYESNSSAVGSSKRKSHTPSPIIKRESQSEDEIVIMDSKSLDSGEFDDLGEGDREAMRKSYGEMLDQPPTKRRVPDSSGAFREKQSSSFLSGLVADTKEKLAETDMADDQDESSLDDATGLENMTADGQTVFDNSAGCSAWDGTGNPPTQGDTQDSVAPPPYTQLTTGIRMRLPTMVPTSHLLDAQPFRRPRYSYKPFECPEPGCGRKFYHRGDVYRHQRINHGAGHIGKPHLNRSKRSRPSYYQEHLQAQLTPEDLSTSLPEFPMPFTQLHSPGESFDDDSLPEFPIPLNDFKKAYEEKAALSEQS